jgi:cephalosporin hydroxylase
MSPEELSVAWHKLWGNGYDNLPVYAGAKCQQFQTDLDRYKQLVEENAPPFILSTGVYWGGTTALLADTLKSVNHNGILIAVDISYTHCHVDFPSNVVCLEGNAVSEGVVSRVKELTKGKRGIVQIDDDHSSVHVEKELQLYADLADILVVEDTIMDYLPEYDDGPHHALRSWLPKHPEFEVMPDPEPTQHVGGWLRRKKPKGKNVG